MLRKGSAAWQGGIRDGRGTVSTEGGVLSQAQYSFGTRFESGAGTNPEELIGAAHAACFSMAFSKQLEEAGHKADEIRTTASVRLEKTDAGFRITRIHLDVTARVPGVAPDAFQTAAANAKAGCPVSRLFNAEITMEARLEG